MEFKLPRLPHRETLGGMDTDGLTGFHTDRPQYDAGRRKSISPFPPPSRESLKGHDERKQRELAKSPPRTARRLVHRTVMEMFLATPRTKGFVKELKEKLISLRNNPDEYEAFQARISEYKQVHGDEGWSDGEQDLVKTNQERVFRDFVPEVARKREKRRIRKEKIHIVEVQKARVAIHDEWMARKTEMVLRREIAADAEQKRLTNRQKNARRTARAKRWTAVVTVCARFVLLQHHLEHFRANRSKLSFIRLVVIRLQANCRAFLARREAERQREARNTIRKHIRSYVIMRRMKMCHLRAWQLCEFLSNIKHQQKILLYIRGFRYKIVKIQRIWRAFMTKLYTHLDLLTLQWERILPDFMSRKRYLSKKYALLLESGGNPKSADIKQKQAYEMTNLQEVPPPIKVEILRKEYKKRERMLREQRAVYFKKLKEFEIQMKRFEDLEAARSMLHSDPKPGSIRKKKNKAPVKPRRPIKKLLLPKERMFQLLEKGFLQLIEEQDMARRRKSPSPRTTRKAASPL